MLTRGLLLVVVLVTGLPAIAKDYSTLFEKVDSAVVTLYTIERTAMPGAASGEVALPGLGSGFVIDDEGHIITAAHVVQTADLVEAEFANGERITAAIITSDPVMDVSLLKLDRIPDDLRTVKLADSDKVKIGEEIFVIGAPLGLTHTLTVGHISARYRDSTPTDGEIEAETFQTDAAINMGNSGGPMFNQRGEVIGVVSFIRSQSGGSEGLGFAITANAAYEALFERRLAWSGMSGTLISGDLAAALNVPQQFGYLVQKVAKNSPAERIGLQPSKVPAIIAGQKVMLGGDIILALQDLEISPDNLRQWRDEAANRTEKGEMRIKILRGGKVGELVAPY